LRLQKKNNVGASRNIYLTLASTLFLLPQLSFTTPAIAADYSLSGESRTIFRMKTTTDDKDLFPLYEYLNMSMSKKLADGASLSMHLGAWGRYDLGEASTNDYSDADLQYGFISYRAAKNNTVANLGRQFVVEGVAAEKIDGLYLRNDFIGGITAAAFAGAPVASETDSGVANLVYGGRISHSMPKYYSVGLSFLKNEHESGSRYREEEGIDIWVHPASQLDLVGRSSYNSITNDWMEHAYTLTFAPLDPMKITAGVSNINYRDYLHTVTTNALRLNNGIINQNESLLATNIGMSYRILKNLTLAADYKNYRYDIAGDANYYGGKVDFALPDFVTGASFHRMDGDNDRLRYYESRLFALLKFDHLNISADVTNLTYDQRINAVRNVFSATGSVGYEVKENLKLGADLEYSQNPDFDDEVRGLVRLVYAFDTKLGEGRGKSEK